jgi:glycosyltransferase involved in cell wall biosynthesis
MTKPRLSICIATYNRAEYIGETLESIVPQITDEVEIVIVDGASTDNTSDVVKRYVEVCKQINYIRLPSKGGIDQDFCKTVEYAKGEYCWLFPDDDLLEPGAINAVLKEIVKGYSLIVVNARVMNKDFSKVLENKRLQIDANEIYSESEIDRLFNRAITYMSFIGCVVINRNLWLQREKERYFGTEFIHVGVIFQAPLPAPALIIAEPYITIRLGNAQWTPRAFEIWMYKWPDLLYSFTHLSEQTRREYRKTQSWLILRNIITFRAMGGYSLKEYQKWLASKDPSLGWRFVILFIVIMPACLVNLFLLSYFKMMWGFVALFIAIMPACFANMFVLSYFKKIKKEALMNIYALEGNENSIMNIMRRKGR